MERRLLEKQLRKAPSVEDSKTSSSSPLALIRSLSEADSGPVRAQSILSKIRLLWVARRNRLYRRLCSNIQREICDYLTEHIIPQIWRNNLVRHNMQTRQRSAATLSVPFETTAVFCSIDEDSVLCVGGKNRITATTYMLSVSSAVLSEMESLSKARGAPGIIKHRRFVYIFGGWDEANHALKASEKFSIVSKRWTPLAEMYHPRSYFSPCVCGDDIYLPRTGQVLEVLNTVSEEFKELPIWLTDFSESRSVSFIDDGELIIITGKNQMGKWRINAETSFRMSEIQMNDSNSGRSNIPPLKRGTAILWVRGHDGALVKFNLENGTLLDK